MSKPKRQLIGAALLPVLLCATPVSAQLVEEITVTAQKREQSLQDVGISVAALSGDQIRQLGFTNSVDVIAQAPNIEVRNVWGEFSPNTTISIRGVSQTDFNDAHESPAVVYVDEFYVLPTAASNFSIYDLERVESLRGPQGTLFGRNATAGLIHYITAKPSQEFEAWGEVTAAEFKTYRFEGAVGGPFSDTVSGRLSVNGYRTDGHVRNTLLNTDRFQNETKAIRGQLLFQPSDRTEVLIKAEHADVEADYEWQPTIGVFQDTDGFIKNIPPGVDFYGSCVQCNAFGDTEDGDITVNRANSPTGIDTKTSMGLLRIEHEFDNFKLTSVTGYLDLDKGVFEDSAGDEIDLVRAAFYLDTQQFTQELRFDGEGDGFRWTVGGLYLDHKADGENGAFLFGDVFSAIALPAPLVFDIDWKLKSESWSLFGQGEWDVSDTMTFTAGLRYTDDKKEYELIKRDFLAASSMNSGRPLLGFPNLIPDFFIDGLNFTRDQTLVIGGVLPLAPAGDLTEQSWDNFAGKLQLDWRPGDDLLVYASLSRGHKAGGFNNGFLDSVGPRTSAEANAAVPYDEEVVHAAEIGFKSTILDGSGRFNGAVFYYDYKDYQSFTFVGLSNSIKNADGKLYGAEAELVFSPTEGLEVLLGASLLDTELKDFPNHGGITGTHEFGLAPKFTANGIVRYEWPALEGTMAVQGDFNYVDERFSSALNEPAYVLDAYTVGNVRVSYATGDDRWKLALFVKNVTDEDAAVYKSELQAFGGHGTQIYLPPRRFGASISFRY